MSLAYDDTRLTRDIDAVFVPTRTVRELSVQIADRHGLSPDWINDAVKGLLPGPDHAAVSIFESETLAVHVASARYLLATKIYPGRQGNDYEDAAKLFRVAGFTSADDAIELLTKMYPQQQLLPRHRYVAMEVAELAGTAANVDRVGQLRSAFFPKEAAPPGNPVLKPPSAPGRESSRGYRHEADGGAEK